MESKDVRAWDKEMCLPREKSVNLFLGHGRYKDGRIRRTKGSASCGREKRRERDVLTTPKGQMIEVYKAVLVCGK